ncbi:MAG TPA: glycosyltransferase family 2 protein, partial [Chitinophagaceae bacterium]
MRLSVIIVSYNVRFFLEQCLYSVMAAGSRLTCEVLVVDNQSSDGSVAYLKPVFPSVRFIESPVNLGFGRANNLALEYANGEFILFLNPDTIVAEDCFEKCVCFLDANRQSGALGARMIDGTGSFLPESKRSFPGPSAALFKMVGLARLFPKSAVFNRYALGNLDDHSNHRVDVLAGAFMMVRKDVLNKTGGFDENFFMYGEDIDLSYRISGAGWQNWYFADTSVIHFKGESTRRHSSRYVKMFYEAMTVFVNKHYRGRTAVFHRMMLKAGIALSAFGSRTRTIGQQQRKKNAAGNTLVLGTYSAFVECLDIYSAAGQGLAKKVFHMDSTLNPDADSIASAALQNGCNELVFCAGSVSYADIVELVETLRQ